MNWAIIATIVLTWVDSLPLVLRVLKRITANHEDAELIAKRNCFMSQNIKISFDNVIIIIYIFLKHCWQRLFPYWSQHKRNNWYVFIFWTNSGNPKPILVLRVFNMNMGKCVKSNESYHSSGTWLQKRKANTGSFLSINTACLFSRFKRLFLKDLFNTRRKKKTINVTFLYSTNNGPHLKWKWLEKKGAFKTIEECRLISAELRTS